MDDISDDWEFIGDIPELDELTTQYVPPVAKSSSLLPPPTTPIYPRTPAAFQVPPALRSSSSSTVVSPPDAFSHSSCRFTKDDVSTFHWKNAGFHRSSLYQISDLQPGVNDRPFRDGYQPQSFKTTRTPPQSLHSSSFKKADVSELPPPPEILQRNLDQQVSAKAKTTRRRGGSTTQQTQLTRLRHPSDSPLITSKFDSLLQEFGPLSDVYQALQHSQFADAHRDRLLNAFGASTVFRYLQSVQQFSYTLKRLVFALTDLTVTQLVDCLAVMSHARASSSDAISGNFTLKALRWFRKIAGISCLDIVFSPLADSFLKVRLTTDKKEAPPLPLWILFHWEKRILFSQSSTFEVIMLGSFLFMTWSSLRFSDVQRLNIESLVLNDLELRGMVWRSKTRSNGHPFGVTCSGLCSTGSFTWLVKFLRTWDTLLADSGCSTWDFLIPNLSEQGTLLSHEPLDYASALRIFREMLSTPWKRFSGPHPLEEMNLNYTLHSPKATLLSFGPQLGSVVDSDDRLQQGHHADPRKSLHLYGRDSVWGALRYQQMVVQQVRAGFRPKTAQHRGGQTPLVEPPVTLECFKKQAVEYTYQYLPFSAQTLAIEVDEAPLTEEIGSSSSSESGGSSQPNEESESQMNTLAVSQVCDDAEFDEIIFAKHRRVTHAMVVTDSENHAVPRHLDKSWRPACGTHMTHEDTKFLSEWDHTMSFCQDPGCKKAWAAAGMF